MIKLLIFDFDDTITNNAYLDYHAFQTPCKTLGIPTPSKKLILYSRKKGFLAKDIMKNHLKKIGKVHQLNDFLIQRDQFLNDVHSLDFLELKPDIITFFNYLKNKKIKCILCTARKNSSHVKLFLKKRKIYKYFFKTYFMQNLGFFLNNINYSNRVLIKSSLLKQILNDSKYDPHDILYVGNSSEDYLASVKLNIPFIYLENNYLNNEHKFDLIKIKNIYQLQKKLESEV